MAFPMIILLAIHGHATDDTFSSLSVARQILENESVDVRGLAFDGDIKYLGFLTAFDALVEQIQKIKLDGGLKRNAAGKGLGIVEDVLYLFKTRYRFAKTVNNFILPFAAKPMINLESWRSLVMSDNLFNDSQAHKHEDQLAMKFLGENSLSGSLKEGDSSFACCPGFS
jgi:hypothetical protein